MRVETRGRKPGSLVSAECIGCGVRELAPSAWKYRCAACKASGVAARWLSDKDACVAEVRLAVQEGRLPRAKGQQCVDCAAPAVEYDHRDYNKPLDVQPVCRACNLRRGPAIPRHGTFPFLIRAGSAPYKSLHRTVQLFQAMRLPVERLAGLPKRLTVDHWRDLLPLFDVEGGDVLVHESSLHPRYV